MKVLFICFSLIFTIKNHLFSQNKIDFIFTKSDLLFEDAKFKIGIYQNSTIVYIDSFSITKNFDTLQIQKQISLNNYYGEMFLQRNNREPYSFIYSNSEEIEFWLDYTSINEDYSIFNSLENDVYNIFNVILNKYFSKISLLNNQKRKLSKFDDWYLKKNKKYEEDLTVLLTKMKFETKLLQSKYPNTYVSKYLVPISIFPSLNDSSKNNFDNNRALGRKHFFDSFLFENSSFLNHSFFWYKLDSYLKSYVNYNHKDEFISIDYIFNFFNKDENVYNVIYNYVLKYYINSKNEYMIEKLMSRENSLQSCDLNLNHSELIKYESIKNTQIGSVLPDIILYDNKNKIKSLYSQLNNKKYTIVLFWVSWCVHCQEEIPLLLELAKTNKSKLNVFAVSLDENKENWIKALPKETLKNWINVSELVPINKSKVAQNFNISATPSVFILNKKGEILYKNIFNTRLKEVINKLN